VKKAPEPRAIEQIAAEFPAWRFWRGKRADGKPGELMATRRRYLTAAELAAGLAITLPMGLFGDLRTQLAEQAELERAFAERGR
jgi:hypothetical protein